MELQISYCICTEVSEESIFWREEDVDTSLIGLIGKANVISEGTDLSIITVSSCLQMVKDIIPQINDMGISAEIIDIRSVVPFDIETILKSVRKTGKVLICDTANKTGSTAANIAALISQKAFEYLKSPINIVANEDIPIPFANNLEKEIILTKEKILNEIRRIYVES